MPYAGLSDCGKPVCLVGFDAEDAASPVARAEYSIDAGPWQTIDPAGQISDSKREHYEISACRSISRTETEVAST